MLILTLRFALVLFSNHIINIVLNVASCGAYLLNILKYLHTLSSLDNDNKILRTFTMLPI